MRVSGVQTRVAWHNALEGVQQTVPPSLSPTLATADVLRPPLAQSMFRVHRPSPPGLSLPESERVSAGEREGSRKRRMLAQRECWPFWLWASAPHQPEVNCMPCACALFYLLHSLLPSVRRGVYFVGSASPSVLPTQAPHPPRLAWRNPKLWSSAYRQSLLPLW